MDEVCMGVRSHGLTNERGHTVSEPVPLGRQPGIVHGTQSSID